MKYHDIKPRGRVYRLKIKDNTHKNGRPTFSNMERKLIKMMKYA